ncbi:MAG: FmdB family zinc ribbon protein [Actinomycetota bacterium]
MDYKCNECGQVSELVIRGDDCPIKCEHCSSKNMVRVFSGVSLKSPSSGSSGDNGSSCSGSCASCSGCR